MLKASLKSKILALDYLHTAKPVSQKQSILKYFPTACVIKIKLQ